MAFGIFRKPSFPRPLSAAVLKSAWIAGLLSLSCSDGRFNVWVNCVEYGNAEQPSPELGLIRADGMLEVTHRDQAVPGLIPHVKVEEVFPSDAPASYVVQVHSCSFVDDRFARFQSNWVIAEAEITQATDVTQDDRVSMGSYLTRCEGQQCRTDTALLFDIDSDTIGNGWNEGGVTLEAVDVNAGFIKASYWYEYFSARSTVNIDLRWETRQ